ncbi:hypothetical protein C6P45_000226 [Maudiozyma exigua]|uniref:Uncharacterized protein n=1 Tax=Maudiozyma exigua TaxID=34358 RepID=A0A9P7B8V8_MAUEX|nr:hypothetical protein C6P45_000226 [Kazachstania exigua]
MNESTQSLQNDSMLNQLTAFVDEQTDNIKQLNNTRFHETEIPLGIQDIINREVNEVFETKVTRASKDILVSRIYELNSAWKLQQLKEVSRFIGDIPKYSIGTELNKKLDQNNSLVSNGGTSLVNIMEDIYNLPLIVIRDSAGETSNDNPKNNEEQLLNEYTNVRKLLIEQCDMIRITEQKLNKAKEQTRLIKSLEVSIEETYGADCTLAEYLPQFYHKLHDGLDEMRDLLEQLIKSSNTSDSKKKVIQDILNEFNIQ